MVKYITIPLPKITKTQKEILYLLYKFRFLNTHQIQKLLHLKKPQYAQELLKDLRDKGLIKTNYNPKSYIEKTEPAIYFLGSKAIKHLKDNKSCSKYALNKIYKEHKQDKSFVHHCMSIADIYFFFSKNIKPDESLTFVTKNELSAFGNLPEKLPSAYLAVKNEEKTKRYFLEVFRETARSENIRFTIRKYFAYAESGMWEKNEKGEKLPSVFLITPTEKMKKHILHYAKALFEKEYQSKFSIFVTTITRVLQNESTLVWEKVEN